MARPTKLTPEVQTRLTTALKLGSSIGAACEAAGVSESTFYNWMDRGLGGESIYADFAVTAQKAKAKAEMRAISAIRNAFAGWNVKTVKTVTKPDGTIETTTTTGKGFCWQAAAWWLGRHYPDRWGKKDRVEVSQVRAPSGFVFEEIPEL